MKIKLSLTLLAFALLGFVQTSQAQYDIDPIYYYNFSPDSLAGFDEAAQHLLRDDDLPSSCTPSSRLEK